MRYFFAHIIIGIFGITSGIAQYTVSNFKKFTTESGLSDNLVRSVMQDEKGFIWVATSNGLNRFDGRQFDIFRSSSGLISSNNVRGLKKFSGDKIGVLSSKGFSVINASAVTAKIFTISDSTALWFDKNFVFDAAEVPGKGYVFTGATGFYAVNEEGKLLQQYEHYSLKDKEAGNKRIFFGNAIFPVSGNDYLLYYLDTQLGWYDAGKNKFTLRNSEIYRQWKSFLVREDNWTIKKQINKEEYLYLHIGNNTLSYFNVQTNQNCSLKLPFEAYNHFYWDSYINFINDSVFAVNCYRSGFFLFTLHRKQNTISINPVLQLPGIECFDIFSDKEERLWVGTAEGLLMEKKEMKTSGWQYTYSNDTKDAEYFNTSVLKYKDKVFVGRYAWDNGLLVYDAPSNKLITRINFYGGNNRFNGVTSMQQYYPDTLWISTEKGLLWFNTLNYNYGTFNLTGLEGNDLAELFPVNKQGDAWLLNFYTNEVAKYHIADRQLEVFRPGLAGFTGMKPKFISYDSYGNVWIAGNGLCHYNYATGKFDTLIKKFAGKYPLEERTGYMIADPHGSLWLGTVDNGILQYQIKEKKWAAVSETDGLPSDIVGTFSPFANNGFWFGSSSNLYRLNTKPGHISISAGGVQLPQSNITSENNHYCYDSSTGMMYFAVRNYLAKFPVSSSDSVNTGPVFIKEMMVNNEQHIHFPSGAIILNHRQNRLALYPSIIDYSSNTAEFQYSIDGSEQSSLSLQNPVILIDRLQPGKHLISVSIKGATAQAALVTIIIKPPFWKTWFFYMAIAGLSAFLFYWLYRSRIKNIRNKAMLNQRLAEFEMKALHAQMNPHFIFNCLNSIKGLIVNNQNTAASQYLNKFSVLVRKNLDHSRSQFISLKENIDYLSHYIDIENYRFENITYNIHVDQSLDTDEILIAPMLLQPLVENAIWHGMKGNRIHIDIIFIPEAGKLVCSISDNGIGIDESMQTKQSSEKSVGLKNIQERISLLNQKFGLEYELSITDKSGTEKNEHGTIATLKFKSR